MNAQRMLPISAFAKVIGGYAFKSKDFVDQGIPVIKIKNIGDKKLSFDDTDFLPEKFLATPSKFKIRYGDVLISLTGSHITQPNSAVGRVARSYSDQVFLLNQRVGKMKVDPSKCDLGFLYYYMTSSIFRDQVGLRSRGAANQANVSGGDIEGIKIPDYPLPIQQKIAHILSAYDNLIENNLKRIKLLEEMAQITYEKWFVRLKFPGYEATPIDTETGLPVGWGKMKVGSLLEKLKVTKKVKSTEYAVKGSIPIIDQSRNFIAGYTDDIDAIINSPEPLIVFGDHTRILKFINFSFARGADGTQIIKSNNNRMPQHLFYFSLLAIDLSDYHYARHFKFLKELEVVVPNADVASEFESNAKKIFDCISLFRNQNVFLKEARDILLPRLMTGMINVDHIKLPITKQETEAA